MRTVTEFLELLKLEWDDLLPTGLLLPQQHAHCIRTESPFSLMFGHDLVEGRLHHLKNKLQ